MSWLVEDLPCFSEVTSSTSWYPLLLNIVFVPSSFDLLALSTCTYSVLLCFLHCLLNPLVSSLYSFAPSAIYHFFKSLLSSQRSRTSLVTHGFFLRRSFPRTSLAASVTAVHGIDVHVVIPQTSEWCEFLI